MKSSSYVLQFQLREILKGGDDVVMKLLKPEKIGKIWMIWKSVKTEKKEMMKSRTS